MALINQEINGYSFTEFIASGGFGSVYKALKNGISYAIKVFREDYVLQEYRLRGTNNRIQREIEIMKTANHPFLIKYIDDFKAVYLNVPSYFLVMEYAEGITLRKAIQSNYFINESHVIETYKKILFGIKALHQIRGIDENKGIIHRDLKPENIIINHDNLKILDYGISKIIDYTSLTSTGNFLGSPLYASPEQIVDSKNIDKRSDLYTLGVILYEMLTLHVPYEYIGLPDLIDKIKNEAPIPPRKWNAGITNRLENIIFKLLEKNSYQRFLNIDLLLDALQNEQQGNSIPHDLSPRFVLRLFDDGSYLPKFISENNIIMHVDFPAIHQFRQKKLLTLIRSDQFKTIIDPETVRFAYGTYTDREGLKKLPYCPPNYEVITPNYLKSYRKQQEYVKLVIDEEAKLGTDIFISPYHYTHNTTVLPTFKSNPVEQWFDLDIKLLKESIDYKNSVPEYMNKPLFAAISINSNSLTDIGYKTDLLNFYTAHDCDGYIVYADGIDKNVQSVVLFHYIDTLIRLQRYTNRPVIAGRLNGLGLGLLSLGLAGFSSGAARFESFSEELHKEAAAGYNLYERYYFPKLLSTIAIERKLPTKLNQISSVIGTCECPYCKGKQPQDAIISQNNKLHFLYCIYAEIDQLKMQSDKKSYFLTRIDNAILNFELLKSVFKRDDFKHLFVWKEVFGQIK